MENASVTAPVAADLEQYRSELTGYCYRMLGSYFEAEDAVQETMLRAWKNLDRFEGRSALRSWLYRIATNVCFDLLNGRERRARPMDLGPAREPVIENLNTLPEVTWIEPIPDPSDVAVERETIRLAFVAALQHLPPRQRAVLILCEVLKWKASEAAELLETSVASVNSALQRARATLEAGDVQIDERPELDEADRDLLARYVTAFEAYDMDALTSLIHEDATQSMPPFDLWLRGRDDVFAWWVGPGIGCKGSRVIPAGSANGSPAYGQYKPSESGDGYEPWALQVVEVENGQIVEITFFLDTERLFPLFGLPADALAGQHVLESHEGHELAQLGRRVAQPHLAAEPLRGELKPRERLAGDRVRGHRLDVADRDLRAVLREQRADAVAQPRQVRAGDRTVDGEGQRARRRETHVRGRPPHARKTIARPRGASVWSRPSGRAMSSALAAGLIP